MEGEEKVSSICGIQVPKSKSTSYPVAKGLDSPDVVWEVFTVKFKG